MPGHYIQGCYVQRNNAQDSLQEDFEPSALPPIGPDGAPEIPPMRKDAVPPPRLCEAGPCRHYHTFTIQLDAAQPIAAEVENGRLIGRAPRPEMHIHVHHYCYPETGIETELGALPVLQCSRWEPLTPAEIRARADREAEFNESEAGQKFQTALDAWLQAQQDTDDVAVAASSIEDIIGDRAKEQAP